MILIVLALMKFLFLQIVIMLYEDPTKESTSEERFHVELHFSPGVNCCVQKDLPPGPGFRPHSRNHEQVYFFSFRVLYERMIDCFFRIDILFCILGISQRLFLLREVLRESGGEH